MVVINEKKDNRKYAFLMTLVPDKAYLESTHFAAFSSNYRKWQKGYSGYVFYHTLDGKFNNGWKFENGKVTMSATQVDENGVDISMGARRKASSGTICTTLTLDFWTQFCMNQYMFTEHNGVQNSPNTPSTLNCGSWDQQASMYLVVCYDDGLSVGNNTPPSSGTSNNGSYTQYDCAGVANGSAFKTDPTTNYFIAGSDYANAYNAARSFLDSMGYSQSESNSYSLSYVLDHFYTGLSIATRQDKFSQFKEQKTNSDYGYMYSPTICP